MENLYAIQFSEDDDLLDIRYDPVFKAVFTRETPSSRGAISSLVSACIKRKITVETIVANEPPITDITNRQIRYDIACKTTTGEKVNIEMSFFPAIWEKERIEFFAGKLFTEQEIRGTEKSYLDLMETFQIAIICNTEYFKDERLIHRFHYYDEESTMSYEGKSWIITMELCKAGQFLEKPANELEVPECWALFLEYLTSLRERSIINEILKREEGLTMASEELMRISRDEEERARLTSELKYLLDMQSYQTELKRSEQRVREKEAEIAEKDAKIAQIQIETARTLKAADVSLDIIAQSTGLSLEEIEEL